MISIVYKMAKQYDETGFSAPLDRDSTCDELVNFLKPVIESSTGKSYGKLECTLYTKQEIYGTNYKIKVAASEKEYLHLHVYKPPNRPAQLNLLETDRFIDDPINVPFDLRNIRWKNGFLGAK